MPFHVVPVGMCVVIAVIENVDMIVQTKGFPVRVSDMFLVKLWL